MQYNIKIYISKLTISQKSSPSHHLPGLGLHCPPSFYGNSQSSILFERWAKLGPTKYELRLNCWIIWFQLLCSTFWDDSSTEIVTRKGSWRIEEERIFRLKRTFVSSLICWQFVCLPLFHKLIRDNTWNLEISPWK